MLTYFLFFFYLFFGTIALHFFIRWKFFPFTIYHTASIVLFKVWMGCLYGWLFLHYYGGDDTWNFFNESLDQTHLLLQHPGLFFREFGPSLSLQATGYHGWEAILFYISHFERWFMIKGLAILNLLSGKNYYIDTLLFEFLVIPGPLLLFKLMARQFPLKTGMNFLLIFFIPSVTFWCSGIRAEALLLLSMAVLIYYGDDYARKPGVRNITGIVIGFLGLLLIRYQFLAVFLPAFGAYLISLKKKTHSPVYFVRIYGVLCLVFFASLFLAPPFQLSSPLREAQQGFFRLHGNTRYSLDSLEPGPAGFIKIFPQAAVEQSFKTLSLGRKERLAVFFFSGCTFYDFRCPFLLA